MSKGAIASTPNSSSLLRNIALSIAIVPFNSTVNVLKRHARFLATDIGDALLFSLSEVIKIKRFSFYDKTAFKGITHLQSGVFR